ncbi:MAG TPA: gas vesicle protein K [Desulfomonilaceae bacterium]|nr:gas vesicle protein K [Desulfomonilaceae bacterium]
MKTRQAAKVKSDSFGDFAEVMQTGWRSNSRDDCKQQRLSLDKDTVKNGLGQHALNLVKLLHEILERQAIRRMEAGALTDQEIERLGITLTMQAQEIERLRTEFGLAEEDLNLDCGPKIMEQNPYDLLVPRNTPQEDLNRTHDSHPIIA